MWRALLALVVMGLGCGGGSEPPGDAGTRDEGQGDALPPGCVDHDGDGAGHGADCAGADCDDTDALTISECGTGCDARPERLGCPCDPEAAPPTCYHGSPGEAGVGTCRAGLQTCVDGVRGPCEEQVLAHDEQCDELDNDCDGLVDDGVGGACGGCGDCESSCFAGADGCASWASGRLDHARSGASGLTLTPEPPAEERVVWPGDGGEEKVFKVSSDTRGILAAYLTTHVRGQEVGIASTVVDREGDLYLGHWGQGWVTKIAAREADCADRNGNGAVDTSDSWDDVRAFDVEDEPEDECILWETRLPDTIRSLALQEAYGLDMLVATLWVGIDDRQDAELDSGYWELDAETGEETGRVVLAPGQGPNALAIDHRGVIWAVDGSNRLTELDPQHLEDGLTVHEIDGPLNQRRFYSLAVDESGVPWPSSVGPMRFDAETETTEPAYLDWQWKAGLTPTAPGSVAPDGLGGLWHGEPGFEDPFRIDIETMEWRRAPVGLDNGVAHLGVDFLDQLWVLTSGDPGAVLELADEAAEPVPVLTECGGGVGLDCIRSPPNGDFTGLPWVLVQPRRGVWTDESIACEQDEAVQWTRLRASASVPAGSRVTLLVRTGTDEEELWQGSWIHVGAAANGDTELPLSLDEASRQHHHMAVQARLEADRHAVDPILERLEVLWGCERDPG